MHSHRSVKAVVAAMALSCTLALAPLIKSHSAESKAIELGLGTRPVIGQAKNQSLCVLFEGNADKSAPQNILGRALVVKDAAWSPLNRITKTTGTASNPDLACGTDGTFNMVWRDTTLDEMRPDIFFMRSKDGGQNWETAVNVSNTVGNSTEPAIAAGDGRELHVVWRDAFAGEKNPEIYYSNSSDGGNSWSAPENVSRSKGFSSLPSIVCDSDGCVHCAWLDTSKEEGHPDVFYAFRKSGKWSRPVDVGHTDGSSSHIGLACSKDGKIYISWTGKPVKEHTSDIVCVSSSIPGKFGKPQNISDTRGISSDSVIVVDDHGCVAIVWSDTNSGAEKPNIMGRLSTDGVDFSQVIDFEKTDMMSRRPHATICGEQVWIVWEESDGVRSAVKVVARDMRAK